jgi:arylsulfatase A-like enzyme
MNILLITLDQFRGDCLGCAGHPIVKTPNLDRLAREGVRLARHYSQSTPCGPGRASLYTGLYQMNHRVVANGAPLDARLDNVAWAARRAGYEPTLFGYTDQAVDPRETTGPDDPRLQSYEGVLPGFAADFHLPMDKPNSWLAWLRERGHAVGDDPMAVLIGESERPAEHSMAAFLTDELLGWMEGQTGPWFAHLSHLRPHPPYNAAGQYATMYDPADVGEPIAPAAERHPLHDLLLINRALKLPADPAVMRAQYYGMISEVDAQLGRVWAALEAAGQWNDTFILVTADHGEQLGDHGLIQKAGWFEESHHILGLVRDPRHPGQHGQVVEAFTENVDVLPTLAEVMGVEARADGLALTPWLAGTECVWREDAHWEFDWRFPLIGRADPDDPQLERMSLAVLRTETAAYVHFADGSWLAFDLAADPTWRTPLTDPAAVLALAQAMLNWRARHADRTLTGFLVQDGPKGRWPLRRS